MELRTLGIRQRLTSPLPATRNEAFKRALGLVHKRPQLALAILTGNFDYQAKREAAGRLRAVMPYPPIHYEKSLAIASLASMISLPPFFRLLANQPQESVRAVHQLWTEDKGTFTGTLERHLAAFSQGYSKIREELVAVTPRASQTIVGYNVKLAMADGKVTDHYLCFISGCQIDGLTFDYQFRPQRSWSERFAEGIWDELL